MHRSLGEWLSGRRLVAEALAALNPDDRSPREAIEALYRLKLLAAKRDET